MFLFVKGDQTTEQYSKLDLTREQYQVFNVAVSLRSLHVLFIRPSILFALAVIMSVREFQDKLQSVNVPSILKFFYLLKNGIIHLHTVSKGYLFPSDSHDLLLLVLRANWLRWLQWWSLSRSSWK